MILEKFQYTAKTGTAGIESLAKLIFTKGRSVKRIAFLVVAAATAGVMVSMALPAGRADEEASSINGVTIPAGYRQWELVAPSHEAGSFDELRAILGNDLSMKAYRDGTLPFPDGAILVKLAWKHTPLVGLDGAFVPGPATKSGLQIMVKDSKKYASTGGWGFARFIGGKPIDEAQTCFACHRVFGTPGDGAAPFAIRRAAIAGGTFLKSFWFQALPSQAWRLRPQPSSPGPLRFAAAQIAAA